MVPMYGRRAFRPESDDDLRLLPAEQRDHLSDHNVGIGGGERAVRVSATHELRYSEHFTRGAELRPAQRA